ncbi:DNA-binding CsgD family transcriptional regulator [Saccharothrix coeruleofusca]|uniref:AAA family ATPase n=1 Tax=Saccharothrix coeruleofusca TaxID=33919 RepID=UPI001AEA8EFC|nr:LuxR family transcriptional regulator [Saccharothrix coeruleofusca]MBP2339057.1 DNA-binding CsgD family transcriptional regulator [Saccharothrix coeruleofusca]
MRTRAPAQDVLVGRREESLRLTELTAAAREGRGGALVLRGEAGIGKSALLELTARVASGFRVVRASGAEFENELPYAALHQLCVPVLGHLDRLPTRHREGLEVAFGLRDGAPDVFRVGLAALDLLTSAARNRPLLCLVDDAHWLDAASARALTLLARRIAAEPVAVVFASRPREAATELDELPRLEVGGLADAEARQLLAARTPLALDEHVREQILAEARGNPLALLEPPAAGGFAPPGAGSVPTAVERGFQARLPGLPDQARLLLTVASADPTGDAGLLWSAAGHLDIDVSTAGAAAAATGLVEFGTRVRFCHPLARSAVYRAATGEWLRRAHAALAEVTDPDVDPDRRAWHRAQATAWPDEDVAAELERSAHRARSRGGIAAAAAFAERAAALSPDPAKRVDRALAAVRARLDSGATAAANALLGTIPATTDPRRQAEVDLLRGKLAFMSHHDGNGPAFMLRAASRMAAVDPAAARAHYLDALEMALVVGRASGVLAEVLAAVPQAPPSPVPDVLDALVLLAEKGHRAAVPLLRKVLVDDDRALWTERPALAVMLVGELWDPHTHVDITEWLVKTGRDTGSAPVLRLALAQVASCNALQGNLGRATEAVAEEEAIADAIGGPPMLYPRLHLAAMRGRRDDALQQFETARATATRQGAGHLIANVHWAEAVLGNGLTDYPAALAAARRAVEHGDLVLAGLALPELVEAAVRGGAPDVAAAALAELTDRTEASGTPTGLGVAAYARALVTGAEDCYREALDHLDSSPLMPYRARAHLLYGEWLRRAGRRRDCRTHLRTAHDLLSTAGLEAFAGRAAVELKATGESARERSPHAHDRLTTQETHVARLVATGATSAEVASRLFLSRRTVDAHLRNIYRKLGISSRRQLKDLPGIAP